MTKVKKKKKKKKHEIENVSKVTNNVFVPSICTKNAILAEIVNFVLF
jgi:hypothetical protein